MAQLEASCSKSLDELRTQNQDASAKIRTQIPNDAAIDAQIAPLRASLKQQLDGLEQQVDALS